MIKKTGMRICHLAIRDLNRYVSQGMKQTILLCSAGEECFHTWQIPGGNLMFNFTMKHRFVRWHGIIKTVGIITGCYVISTVICFDEIEEIII